MELEQAADGEGEAVALPLDTDAEGVLRSNWAPLLPLLADADETPARRAAMFHETMARVVLDQARALQQAKPFAAVGLSGGVFQNRRLAERVVTLLTGEGFDVRLHEQLPANDGGLCFGQIVEALASQDGP